MPLVITYHPRFHDLGKIIRKNFIYLYVEQPLIREKGSTCCGKGRCETCFNIKETNTFQSFVTKKVYKINHYFHCDNKCIVYLLSSKVRGQQYVGSTVDKFRLTFEME